MGKDLDNISILCVEDSSTQAALLQETLLNNQYQVRMAVDGVDALEKLKEGLPDLIISDLMMPRMNGFDFCKSVKSTTQFKEIPVILFTTLSDVLDVIKGIECGADGFLTKPCETQLLLTTIQNAVKNKEIPKKASKDRLEFFFEGNAYQLDVDQAQVTKLLLSTYSSAMQKNLELEEACRKLSQMHDELEAKNETLKGLVQQKNQILGMAAHDLRNPLTVISGFSSFLLNMTKMDHLDKDKLHKMIQHIHDSCNFMLYLINNLLEFSIIESGTVSLNVSQVDLVELVQKNMIFFECLGQDKDVKVLFDYPTNLPKVSCDPNKVVQIFNNLISNAIKFSHPHGVVKITLTYSEKEVLISVEDQGTGMAPEVLNHLFQPFFKGKTKGTIGEKGSGLGLAITHKIVLEHHGKIWAESQPDKGTTFFVLLPIKN